MHFFLYLIIYLCTRGQSAVLTFSPSKKKNFTSAAGIANIIKYIRNYAYANKILVRDIQQQREREWVYMWGWCGARVVDRRY